MTDGWLFLIFGNHDKLYFNNGRDRIKLGVEQELFEPEMTQSLNELSV